VRDFATFVSFDGRITHRSLWGRPTRVRPTARRPEPRRPSSSWRPTRRARRGCAGWTLTADLQFGRGIWALCRWHCRRTCRRCRWRRRLPCRWPTAVVQAQGGVPGVLPSGRLPSFASVMDPLPPLRSRPESRLQARGLARWALPWVAMDVCGSPVARAETRLYVSDLAEASGHRHWRGLIHRLLARVRPGQPALGN